MILQEKTFGYKYLALDIARKYGSWEFYIEENDFPEYPDIRSKKGLVIYVQQLHFLTGKYKGRITTKYWMDRGKPWDRKITDKMKKLIIERVDPLILDGGHELSGKNTDPFLIEFATQDA